MVERGLGPKTIRTDGVLRAVFSWTVNTDLIDRSPCRGIRSPEMLLQDHPARQFQHRGPNQTQPWSRTSSAPVSHCSNNSRCRFVKWSGALPRT